MSSFLTAEWRKLIMAQYVVDPGVLATYLPPGTELDLFRDRCYVSLVGFLFDRVRIKGIAIPFHTCFEEINLRFYVRRVEADGTSRRGVVFIREFVPRAAITLVANVLYEEPYRTRQTCHAIAMGEDSLDVCYEWRHQGRWNSLAVNASRTPHPIESGSEEEFITEHYWGYTKRRKGSTSAYEVLHPRWLTYPVLGVTIDVNFSELYGGQFATLSTQETSSVLLAEGSAVSVAHGFRLPGGLN